MPPPDHCLHIVLKEDRLLQPGKICRGSKMIHNRFIKALGSDQVFKELAHAGRVEPADRNRNRREYALRQLCKETRRALIQNLVLEWIAACRILVTSPRTFRMRWI